MSTKHLLSMKSGNGISLNVFFKTFVMKHEKYKQKGV